MTLLEQVERSRSRSYAQATAVPRPLDRVLAEVTPAPTPERSRNHVLRALPPQDRETLGVMLHPVRLERRKVLIESNYPIDHVYFVEEGVVSIVNVLSDGSVIETVTVGNEGIVGLPVFLGSGSMPSQAFVQVPGTAYRLPSGLLVQAVERMPALRHALNQYTHAMFTLLAQTAACNRKHSMVERCARWLLMTHDRVGRDEFELTQLFLSQMLGVRRASVSVAAAVLQDAGLIEYTRGRIHVLDRAGLERSCCECYSVIHNAFAFLTPNNAVERTQPLVSAAATTSDGV